jgi:TDG/mug DNA glycosylase family protein
MNCVGFPPVAREDARALILGSLPGKISLQRKEYYANQQNAFWFIMGKLVGASPDLPYQERLDRLRTHGIALWDVCEAAQREGSLDANIVRSGLVANDLKVFLRIHPNLRAIFFNGTAAARIFRQKVQPSTPTCNIQLHTLVSTSPARTLLKVEKLSRWEAALKPYLNLEKRYVGDC